jgi:putative transposase
MAPGGLVYHVLNRANARQTIFHRDGDYLAFERALAEAQERIAMRILAWCLMPNHWHLILWPYGDGELSEFMRLVTLMHTHRWHAHHATTGAGHLYQGRFKSFIVQDDRHFLTVCRYVERNALRAKLVERAEDWRWGSLWRTKHRDRDRVPLITEWPIDRPHDWVDYVNRAETPAELESVRQCIERGRPFGQAPWRDGVAKRLGLESTLRPRGRPKKGPDPFFRS